MLTSELNAHMLKMYSKRACLLSSHPWLFIHSFSFILLALITNWNRVWAKGESVFLSYSSIEKWPAFVTCFIPSIPWIAHPQTSAKILRVKTSFKSDHQINYCQDLVVVYGRQSFMRDSSKSCEPWSPLKTENGKIPQTVIQKTLTES